MPKRVPKVLAASLLTGILAIASASSAVAQAAIPSDGAMPKVGDTAPDFKLHYFDGNDLKEVNLSDYHGKKNVVLAFFIFAFTGG